MKKPTLRLETVELRKLKPHPQNAKVHSPDQLKAIGKSLQENGWTRPILVNEHMVILAGHGTAKAAKQVGMTEAPVVIKSGLTQAQQRAYVLADNALAERSSWDEGLLGQEMIDLKGMGIDLELTGFDPDEIARLVAPPAPQRAEDEPPTPEPKGPAVSKLGDMWTLGRHRVICGDSTKPETYEALMLGEQAQVNFTDPPYGVSYVARSGRFEMIIGDALRRGQLLQMLTGAFQAAAPHCKEDAAWYVWHASSTREDFARALRDTGLVELGYIIWAKPQMVLGWSDYRWAHEPCFYASKQGQKPAFYGDGTDTTVWRAAVRVGDRGAGPKAVSLAGGLILTGNGGRDVYVAAGAPKNRKVRHVHVDDEPILLAEATDMGDVWEVSRDNGHGKHSALHPNQKPVELPRRAIKNSSQEGEIILDEFGGSGSTLIAAEQLNRKAYLIELDPANVDVIVRRWEDYTNQEAIHAETGKAFNSTEPSQATKARARAA